MKKIIIIVFLILILAGCSDHDEINELGIVSALGIEKIDDEYIVTAQLINIKKSEEQNTNTSNIVIFKENGKTLFEALRRITNKSSMKLYFPHMKIVVLDKSALEDDPYEIVDFFARDSESMLNFYLLVTDQNTPHEVLETLTLFEDIPAEYIVKSLKTSEESYGNAYTITFEKYMHDLITKGIDPIFTKIKVIENTQTDNNIKNLEYTSIPSYFEIGNLLIYNNENKLEELSASESISFSILNNNATNGIITLKCFNDEKKSYTLEIVKNETKMQYKNNSVNLDTNITLSVSDYQCDESLLSKENEKKIKNESKEFLEKENNALLSKSLKYENDILGIGSFIMSKDKNYKEENYKELSLKSNINVEIEKRGNLYNYIKEKKNE